MDLYKSQKQKQQKEYDAPCDCTKWKKRTIQIVDRETDEVLDIEVCAVCGKEVK